MIIVAYRLITSNYVIFIFLTNHRFRFSLCIWIGVRWWDILERCNLLAASYVSSMSHVLLIFYASLIVCDRFLVVEETTHHLSGMVRRISLLCCVCKFFEIIAKNALMSRYKRNILLHSAHFSFVPLRYMMLQPISYLSDCYLRWIWGFRPNFAYWLCEGFWSDLAWKSVFENEKYHIVGYFLNCIRAFLFGDEVFK